MIYDISACTGRWPFRKLYKPNLSDLVTVHEKNKVSKAVVTNLESVFFNDPLEGDEDLAALLPLPYKLALIHNPFIPYALDEMERNTLNAAAVRLCPGIHKYSVADSCVIEFCQMAARKKKPVYITYKFDDFRLEYQVFQRAPDINDILKLVMSVKDGLFILSGFTAPETVSAAVKLKTVDNLYIDSTFFGSLHPFERVCGVFPAERILYGSLFPLQCMESTLMALEKSDIGDEAKERIMYRNAEAIFGG